MLNGHPSENKAGKAALRRFAEIDWDFANQASGSPFSSLHWHPCRFPSQIPALAISKFSRPGDLILEPFMGSATTLVEAQRTGRRSIGIDINPISCLIGKAKTLTEGSGGINLAVSHIKTLLAQRWDDIAPTAPPQSVQGEKWYMPRTLVALRKLWTMINDLTGERRVIALACFSSILLPSCREDRHWGYVCDNTQPKSFREPDAKSLFLSNLDRLAAAYAERESVASGERCNAEIVNDDAISALSILPSDSADCFVTSPPYFGVSDYVKAQRLSMEWFSIDIEPLRRRETGARSKRHRTLAEKEYLDELVGVFSEVYRIQKTKSWGVIVFGQSPSRPDIQTDFCAELLRVGYSIEFQTERQIAIGRRQKPSIAEESIIVVRK